jgi:hypothetical protein
VLAEIVVLLNDNCVLLFAGGNNERLKINVSPVPSTVAFTIAEDVVGEEE